MKKTGFTIIELMIVVLIIGVLAAIAIPSYNNYVVRVRVIEGLSLASKAQSAIADVVSETNDLPASQAATYYQSPQPTENIEFIMIANDGSGAITIDYTDKAGGGTIILQPTLHENKQITWDCTGGTLEARYRPPNCRK